MISERSVSSAACSESASRIGAGMLGETVDPGDPADGRDRRVAALIPSSGSRSQAARTLSRFIIGSPMPMNTAWSTGPSRRKCSAWSRISDAVRLRPKRIEPVAQNVQVSGQPDCEETHSERRPSR